MPYLSLVLMFELSYRNKISKIIKLFPKHKPIFILFHGNLDTSMVVYTREKLTSLRLVRFFCLFKRLEIICNKSEPKSQNLWINTSLKITFQI